MRIINLHYVFSFICIFFICLSQPAAAQKKGIIQRGLATWYGSKFHGKPTTSGEVYNKNRLTAAHLTLPFGTRVKVTNPITKQSVIVRINDRGPFGNKKRIIDLSEAAARKIDVFADGSAPVIVEVLSADASLPGQVEKLTVRKPTIIPATAQWAAATPDFIKQTSIFSVERTALIPSVKINTTAQRQINNSNQQQSFLLKEESIISPKVYRVLAEQFASRASAEYIESD